MTDFKHVRREDSSEISKGSFKVQNSARMESTENKKRPIDDEEMNGDSEEFDVSDEEEVDEVEDEQLGENDHEVQIEFEGQPPIEADFHGIKNLLNQLFLKAHINLSALAELIIEQNYVGSILRVYLIHNYVCKSLELFLDF